MGEETEWGPPRRRVTASGGQSRREGFVGTAPSKTPLLDLSSKQVRLPLHCLFGLKLGLSDTGTGLFHVNWVAQSSEFHSLSLGNVTKHAESTRLSKTPQRSPSRQHGTRAPGAKPSALCSPGRTSAGPALRSAPRRISNVRSQLSRQCSYLPCGTQIPASLAIRTVQIC